MPVAVPPERPVSESRMGIASLHPSYGLQMGIASLHPSYGFQVDIDEMPLLRQL